MKKKYILFTLTALLLVVSEKAESQSYRQKDSISSPRIYINAGIYFPQITTNFRIDSDLGLGTEISLEDDLNFPESMSVFKANALVHIKGRSQLDIGFTSMNRSKELILDRDINVQDTTFHLGANLKVKFDVDYYKFTWKYSFFNEVNWNAGASFGIRLVNFKANFNADFNSLEPYSAGMNITAPAPVFGLHGSGYLTSRFLARYDIQFFYVDINGIRFNVIESTASLQYYIANFIGLGIEYNTNSYRINELPLSEDFKGRIEFDFNGLSLFAAARF